MSRPTIARITDCVVSSSTGLVRTWRPSRITVTRWQIAKISSSRCETKSTALPCARNVSTMPNSRSTSVLVSAAVGSSITITRAFVVSAFAISTSCWSAIESPRASRSGSSRTPSCSNTAAASRRIRLPSMRRNRLSGCMPTKMFSATVRSGKSVGSWKMIAIPAACDCLALSKIASSPSSSEPAGVGPVDAGEDLDEGGLPGAVLADEAVHLARVELDVAVLEGVDGAEALLGVLERDHWNGWRLSSRPRERGAPRKTRRPSACS